MSKFKIVENFVKLIKKDKFNETSPNNNDIKIIDEKPSYKCISCDDAYYLFYKMFINLKYPNCISGLQLNTIFSGLCDEKKLQVDSDISNYTEIFIGNMNIDIFRAIILDEKNINEKYFILAIKKDENYTYQGKFVLYNYNDKFAYFQPSKELLNKGVDDLILINENRIYYSSFLLFYEKLSNIFSVRENTYLKVLVLKLLFTQFTDNLKTQNQILQKSQEYLSRAINIMTDKNSSTLKPKSLDINNNDVEFDACIVFNAFVKIYNSLPEPDRDKIKELYNKRSSLYYSKTYMY